jgi:hypothetical protein
MCADKEKFARKCSACGAGMNEGYIIWDGSYYFCSDDCLHTKFTQEEYLEMYNNGDNDTFWTDWYDIDEDDDEFDQEGWVNESVEAEMKQNSIGEQDLEHLKVMIEFADAESDLRKSLQKIYDYISKQQKP